MKGTSAITKKSLSKEARLIDAAVDLFHKEGYIKTTLKEIAEHANIPLGNVYYYFKTKEELGIAAGIRRLEGLVEQLKTYDAISCPKHRVIESVAFFKTVKTEFTHLGCPVARVIEELDPGHSKVGLAFANVTKFYIDWIYRQLSEYGLSEDDAEAHSRSIVVGIHGAALLAKTYSDSAIFSAQIDALLSNLNEI